MNSKVRADRILSHLQANEVAANESKKSQNLDSKSLVSIQTIVNGVAVIVINFPPVNSFHPLVAKGLADVYETVCNNTDIKAAVLTGQGEFFMAGADIPNIQQTQKSGDTKGLAQFLESGHELVNRIESGQKPFVAAVNGQALGGGLELAMMCHARVGVPKSVYGLPELNLGIIPGLGGTQRLPRLIGLKPAVDITLSSKNLKAEEARKLGLVDVIVKNPKDLIPTAIKIALDIATKKQPRRNALFLEDKIGTYADGVGIVATARAEARKKNPSIPHPFAYLDAVEEGLKNGGMAGIKKEIEVMKWLVLSPSAKSLVHIFLATRETSKIPGLKAKGKKLKKVAVIGGGTMGSAICIVYLMRGYEVILKEVNEKFLLAGVERIVSLISEVIKRRKMDPMTLEFLMRSLTPQTTYAGFETCDLVIEAVIENLSLKQSIFETLEKICNKNCILATNTSTIDIDKIAEKTKAQSRIIGLHFFSPAHVMPLLEIVRTSSTSEQTIATSMDMSKVIGKTPVLVGNCVGFTANRIFFPYGQAASFLVDHGIDPYQVDKAILAFGMPMGPFQMSDLSGLDIFEHVNKMINSAYGSRCYNSPLINLIAKDGRYGQKTKAGIYRYEGRAPKPDPAYINKQLQAIRTQLKTGGNYLDLTLQSKNNNSGGDNVLTPEHIAEICIFPVINESCRVLDEGHVIRGSDIDIVSVTGYGFPAWRGGVFFYGSTVGYSKVYARLKHYSDVFGAKNPIIRSFFQPSDYLKRLANQ